MKLKTFRRKLRECSDVAILLGSLEPLLIQKRIASEVVRQWMINREDAQSCGYTGRLFVLMAPLPGEEGFVLVIGVHESIPGAEEVTP